MVKCTPSIWFINSVDKPNFRVSLPHRRSTTVSLETNPLYSVKFVYCIEFPALCTGTHIVLMSVNDPVPSVVNVHGFECRVWCPGQPAFCSVCRSSGHLPRSVHSRAFAGVASSPVTWLVSVGRPGASLVLRPPRLFRHRLRLLSIPSPILFPLRPILFLFLFLFLSLIRS